MGLSSPAVFIDAREPMNAIESAAGLKVALLNRLDASEKAAEALCSLTTNVPDAAARTFALCPGLARLPSKPGVWFKSAGMEAELKAPVPADAGLEDVLEYVGSRLARMRPEGADDSEGPWPVGSNGRPSLAPLLF